jgi:hypothetical protein
MVKKKPEGIEALKHQPSIQEITMLDWYAAFALFNLPVNLSDERKAVSAFEIAHAMLKEREQHV